MTGLAGRAQVVFGVIVAIAYVVDLCGDHRAAHQPDLAEAFVALENQATDAWPVLW